MDSSPQFGYLAWATEACRDSEVDTWPQQGLPACWDDIQDFLGQREDFTQELAQNMHLARSPGNRSPQAKAPIGQPARPAWIHELSSDGWTYVGLCAHDIPTAAQCKEITPTLPESRRPAPGIYVQLAGADGRAALGYAVVEAMRNQPCRAIPIRAVFADGDKPPEIAKAKFWMPMQMVHLAPGTVTFVQGIFHSGRPKAKAMRPVQQVHVLQTATREPREPPRHWTERAEAKRRRVLGDKQQLDPRLAASASEQQGGPDIYGSFSDVPSDAGSHLGDGEHSVESETRVSPSVERFE